MNRLFKKKIIDEGRYELYEPTIYYEGSVSIPDTFAKQNRIHLGFDHAFVVKRRKK